MKKPRTIQQKFKALEGFIKKYPHFIDGANKLMKQLEEEEMEDERLKKIIKLRKKFYSNAKIAKKIGTSHQYVGVLIRKVRNQEARELLKGRITDLKRMTKACIRCGKNFVVPASRGHHIYCSARCGWESKRKYPEVKAISKNSKEYTYNLYHMVPAWRERHLKRTVEWREERERRDPSIRERRLAQMRAYSKNRVVEKNRLKALNF